MGFFQRCGIEAQRDGADGFYVQRDVFASAAVAARYGADECTIFVLQGDAQAVEFVFGDVLDFFMAADLADAAIEFAEVVVRIGIVEAEHGAGVLDGFKSRTGCAADTQRGRIGSDEFRVGGLQFVQAGHQTVIGGIGNFRVVLDVIFVLVMAQLFAQVGNLLLDGGGSGLGHGSGP